MKFNKILFLLSFVGIANIAIAGFFNDDEAQDKEIKDLKDKQANVEKKLNQLDRKLDQVLKAISKINTAGTGTKNKPKQQNKRKPADPNYVHKIDQGNSMFMGNPNAKVTITEFFDFQWPYCAKSVSLIEQILEKYPNDVKVVFKNFPLGSHKQARKAGKYALAADRQGDNGFKKMFMSLFDDKDTWRGLRSDEDLPLKLAAELGMNVDQLKRDMQDPALDAQIDQEYNQLKALGNAYETENFAGVRLAVPKFFINGREPVGRSFDAFSKVIEEELKK